jgi:hypothetical protein
VLVDVVNFVFGLFFIFFWVVNHLHTEVAVAGKGNFVVNFVVRVLPLS